VEIYVPTPEELQAFRDATQPRVLEWIKTQVSPKWIDYLFEEIEKVK